MSAKLFYFIVSNSQFDDTATFAITIATYQPDILIRLPMDYKSSEIIKLDELVTPKALFDFHTKK